MKPIRAEIDGRTIRLLAAYALGTLTLLATEWLASVSFGWSATPGDRRDRMAVVAALATWAALCVGWWLALAPMALRSMSGWSLTAGLTTWLAAATSLPAQLAVLALAAAVGIAVALPQGAHPKRSRPSALAGRDRTGQRLRGCCEGILWAVAAGWLGADAMVVAALAVAVAAWLWWPQRLPAVAVAVGVATIEVALCEGRWGMLLAGTMAGWGGAVGTRSDRRWPAGVVAGVGWSVLSGPPDPWGAAYLLTAALATRLVLAMLAADRRPPRWLPWLAVPVAFWMPLPATLAATFVLGAGAPRARRPAAPVPTRWLLAVVLLAVAVRAGYWAYTDRTWEDALITVRHAQNAAAGAGLTHHPAHGRVHGFTSPLSVLIPLAGELTFAGSGVEVSKLAALLAAAATVWYAGRLAAAVGLSRPATLLWLGYLALDPNQIEFGMAGMETQVYTAVLVAGVWTLVSGRWLALGGLLATAAYARPDAVVWIAVALAATAFAAGWRLALRVAAVAAIGVLPWLAFTVGYYGSPVPNTVRAKSQYLLHAEIAGRPPSVLGHVAAELRHRDPSRWLAPYYQGHGLGPVPTVPLAGPIAVALVMSVGFGVPRLLRPRLWAAPAFVAGSVLLLFGVVGLVFPWYVPPTLALAWLLVAAGVDRLGPAAWPVALVLLATHVAPLPAVLATSRAVQRIEDQVRRPAGLWLRSHAAPDEYVTAECLGYLGYHSRRPFHDYPGLSSPRAWQALRAEANRGDQFIAPIVRRLRPTWLVLRPRERGFATADYERVHSFRAAPATLEALTAHFPIDTIDEEFHIYRRREERSEAAR